MGFISDGSAKETETVLGPIRELSGFSHRAGRRAPGWTSRQDPWTLERWPPSSLHYSHENGGSGAPRTPGSRTRPGWGSRLTSGPHRGLSTRKAGDNLRLDVPAVASITNPTPHAPRTSTWTQQPGWGASRPCSFLGSRKWSSSKKMGSFRHPPVRAPRWEM